jgi:hypothetical protein
MQSVALLAMQARGVGERLLDIPASAAWSTLNVACQRLRVSQSPFDVYLSQPTSGGV